jgi:hypothetical protein
MAPLGHRVVLFGEGSPGATSVPGHADDELAYVINVTTPVLLTAMRATSPGDSRPAWRRGAGITLEPLAAM